MFATRDIEPEEEICFNYSGDQGDDDDNGDEEDEENLRGEAIYVKCMCEAARCTGEFYCQIVCPASDFFCRQNVQMINILTTPNTQLWLLYY